MVMAYSAKDIVECHAANPGVMMEVMMGTAQRFDEFDRTGVPWRNIIAFVGHTQTPEAELCRRIRAKGASCMVGTSRNIDREFLTRRVTDMKVLRPNYRTVLGLGVDIIETDIPRELGPVLFGGQPVAAARAKFFRAGRP
jgi:glycerophosphoryl diester phosphodiesterase